MLGQMLGHYSVLEKIGAGGMGEVYRAHDEQLDRDVAIKVLSVASLGDLAARTRLLREARSVAALNHPNVCTVHEVGEADGQVYIAMEWIEGQPLDRLIPEGGLPVDHVVRYGLQIAHGVAHAHDRQIVHRDLKPGNVVITPQGRAKVLDFGLAKRVSSKEPADATTQLFPTLTESGSLVGTVAYMSPEQLRGQKADACSDVWAMGVVLYEMAVGARPFHGQTFFELSSAILSQRPLPLPGKVPVELRAVIARCLEKHPGRRYQRAGEVCGALEAIQSGAVTPWKTWRYRLGRSRWLALAGALMVVLALLPAILLNVDGVRDRLTGRHSQASDIRLAVLPFENLTGDPEQEYFSDGLTEEMIAQLGRLHPQGLSVIARTSSMRYKNSDKPIDQIGRELGVDYLLEGSARREASRVRITATLVQVRDQTQRWTESYERELAGILSLQSDVARGVAGSLAIALLPAEQASLASARPVNPEAYAAYLQGRFHWYRGSPQDLDTARVYFERALDIDPNYAVAYVGLADALATPAHMGFMPTTEIFPKARSLVMRALALDDTLPEAHDLLARFLFAWDWDWPAAEREFHRAFELNPNYPDAHTVFAQLLQSSGRFAESIDEARRALELDPQNPFYQSQVARALSGAGRNAEAIAEFQKMLAADPNSFLAHDGLWDVYYLEHRYDDAIREATESFVALGRQAVGDALARGYKKGGYSRAMEAAANIVTSERTRTYAGAITIARFYAHAGLNDRALEWLERGVVERDSRMVYVVGDPVYEAIRHDARFQDLWRRMKTRQ